MTIMPWTGPGPNPEQPWGAPTGLMGQQRRGGLFGATPAMQSAMTAQAAPMAPKKGFDWGKLIGVLGDSLSIAGGGQAQFVPNMIDQRNRRQAQDYAEQTYQRRRGDEMQDWQAKQQWEIANKQPVNNDTVNDFNWYKNLSEQDRAIYHRMKPEYRQGPDGKFYRIEVAPTGPAPTFTEDDWNKGTPVTGGPTPRASGNF